METTTCILSFHLSSLETSMKTSIYVVSFDFNFLETSVEVYLHSFHMTPLLNSIECKRGQKCGGNGSLKSGSNGSQKVVAMDIKNDDKYNDIHAC